MRCISFPDSSSPRMRASMSRTFAFVLCAFLGASSALEAQEPRPARIDVVAYDVSIEPDIAPKSVRGSAKIDFSATNDGDFFELDKGALVIDSVTTDGAVIPFKDLGRTVAVAGEFRAGRKSSIEIAYHGAPRFGLQFVPEKRQAYTIFSTSQWMPCIDAPSDRAKLRLHITAPLGLVVVANGASLGRRNLGDGRAVHEWKLDVAAPSFSFGFAIGPFTESGVSADRVALRFLGADVASADLSRVFAETAAMTRF